MKREVEKEQKLPAFALTGPELELLWGRLNELFEPEKPLRSRLHLTLPNEKLQFDGIDELKSYDRVRGRVTQFEIEFSQESKSISVRSAAPIFRSTATVKARADSDVWIAGAINTVQTVVQPNRAWYWWFVNWPFLLTFFILSLVPWASSWLGVVTFKDASPRVALAWFSVVLLLGFLAFTKDRLLPAAALIFTDEPNFVRRYGAEIGLVLGVISIILAIVALI
ncbi:MAG: hypothetical protein V4568_00630 [Pseudomonadota bacterium]